MAEPIRKSESEPGDGLRKGEVKWWLGIIALLISIAVAWGSQRMEITTCTNRVAAMEIKYEQSTADRLILETRLTRIETKLDNLLALLGEQHP